KVIKDSYPAQLADLTNIQYVDMSGGINATNAAALIGGVFQAHPLTQTKIPIVKKAPSKPPVDYSPEALPTIANADELNITPTDLDGTEPLTRLPLPNQNPLPSGVTATLNVTKSPSLGELKQPIHTTNFTVGR